MKKKILVVDDEVTTCVLLEHFLSPQYEIFTTNSGIEALTWLETNLPDLILSDIQMPKMDGLAFLRNLMRLRPMPVVMVSSLTQKGADVTLEALSLGAIDYVAKPKNNHQNSLALFQNNLVYKSSIRFW